MTRYLKFFRRFSSALNPSPLHSTLSSVTIAAVDLRGHSVAVKTDECRETKSFRKTVPSILSKVSVMLLSHRTIFLDSTSVAMVTFDQTGYIDT